MTTPKVMEIFPVCTHTWRLLSSVQFNAQVRLFVTPWTAAHQASLSITNSQSLLKLMSIKSVMPSNHLSGSEKEGVPPYNKHGYAPTGFCSGIRLSKKLHMGQVGEGPMTSQVWGKKHKTPRYSPNVNKDLEGQSYESDLKITSLLLSSPERMPICFLPYAWMCISTKLLTWINKLFPCALSRSLCYVFPNKICTHFYSFCLLETFFAFK